MRCYGFVCIHPHKKVQRISSSHSGDTSTRLGLKDNVVDTYIHAFPENLEKGQKRGNAYVLIRVFSDDGTMVPM